MIILGLTGSIGMGKSTTADMFRDAGLPVYDADASVHALYAGKAAPLIEKAFTGTVVDGVVDRKKLGEQVIGKAEAMETLEAIVHPLVAEIRNEFLEAAERECVQIAVLDIPLLFETGGESHCDYVVVITTSPQEQRRRVLSREGMNEEKFDKILAGQMPDKEKRKRADFIIDTSNGLEDARGQVNNLIEKLMEIESKNRTVEVPRDA